MATQTKAILKYTHISPQKGRLVADLIRGLPIARALEILRFSSKKAAKSVRKVLESAIANAEHNEGADIDELRVRTVYIDEAPVVKRWRARAKGRGTRIVKRYSHITVIVGEQPKPKAVSKGKN